LLGHIASVAQMQPIATDVTHVTVCVSVCFGHTHVLYKNGWTDRDAVRGLTHVGPRNNVEDGSQKRTNPFAAVMGDKSEMHHHHQNFQCGLNNKIIARSTQV